MPLLLEKSLDILVKEALNRISNIDGATTPGSNLRLLTTIMNSPIADFYEMLQQSHLNNFVSTAKEDCLDYIGVIVNCVRAKDESDDEYRNRIINQVTTLERCNELSIRTAVLNVEHIADVKIDKFTYGTGSLSLFLIPDNYNDLEAIKNEVMDILDKNVAYGIRYSVDTPELLEVSLHMNIIFMKETSEDERKVIKQEATKALKDYINSRQIGEAIIYNELISQVMNVSEYIYDTDVSYYAINQEIVLHVNQDANINEKFIEAKEDNAIEVF